MRPNRPRHNHSGGANHARQSRPSSLGQHHKDETPREDAVEFLANSRKLWTDARAAMRSACSLSAIIPRTGQHRRRPKAA